MQRNAARLAMECKARTASMNMRLSEATRAKFKSAADKLEVANGLEAALERRAARLLPSEINRD